MIHCRMHIFTFDGTKTHLCLCVCVNRSLCPVWTPVYMDRVYIQYTSKTGAFNIFMICSSVQPNYISCAVVRQTLKTPVSNTMNLYQRIYICIGLRLSSTKITREVLYKLLLNDLAPERAANTLTLTFSHVSHHCGHDPSPPIAT